MDNQTTQVKPIKQKAKFNITAIANSRKRYSQDFINTVAKYENISIEVNKGVAGTYIAEVNGTTYTVTEEELILIN